MVPQKYVRLVEDRPCLKFWTSFERTTSDIVTMEIPNCTIQRPQTVTPQNLHDRQTIWSKCWKLLRFHNTVNSCTPATVHRFSFWIFAKKMCPFWQASFRFVIFSLSNTLFVVETLYIPEWRANVNFQLGDFLPCRLHHLFYVVWNNSTIVSLFLYQHLK